MDIKDFYHLKERGKRTKFSLKERLDLLPRVVWEEIYKTLTDKTDVFGRDAHKFHTLINDKNSDLSLYEAAVICKAVGCSVFELMNKNVSLLPIYLKKMVEDEKEKALNDYGLIKD